MNNRMKKIQDLGVGIMQFDHQKLRGIFFPIFFLQTTKKKNKRKIVIKTTVFFVYYCVIVDR